MRNDFLVIFPFITQTITRAAKQGNEKKILNFPIKNPHIITHTQIPF